MSIGQDIERYLEEEISASGGFVGAFLDEKIVALIEEELARQNRGVTIFYLLAVDPDGHVIPILSRDRAEATTFKTEADAFADAFDDALRETGESGQVEEVETISIVRFKQQSPTSHITKSSRRPVPGAPCIPSSSRIKSRR